MKYLLSFIEREKLGNLRLEISDLKNGFAGTSEV